MGKSIPIKFLSIMSNIIESFSSSIKIWFSFLFVFLSISTQAQFRLSISPSLNYRLPLFTNSMEYKRNSEGSNIGLGLGLKMENKTKYLILDLASQKEQYIDIVKDEWKPFENLDTIRYSTLFRNVNFGVGLNIIDKKIKIYYESGVVLSNWLRSYAIGYGPKNKKIYDTIIGKDENMKMGMWLRNGIAIQHDLKRFGFILKAYTDVMLRPYWKLPKFINSIEPYTRAAVGFELKLAYNIYQNK